MFLRQIINIASVFFKKKNNFLRYHKHNIVEHKKQTYIQNICSKFYLKSIDYRKYVRYNMKYKERLFATFVLL